MLKLVVFAAFIASASAAGGLHTYAAPASAPVLPLAHHHLSYAAGPALGTPLVGSVSYTAPEVSIVKQPITVDQPEVRYHAVPRVVQTAPIVKTTVVQPPPIHQTTVLQAPSPIIHKYTNTHHTLAAAPVALHAHAHHAAAVPLAAAAAAPVALGHLPAATVPLHAHHAHVGHFF